MRVRRDRAGAGRGRDQGRARRAQRGGGAAIDQAAVWRRAEDPNFKDGENYYADQSDNFFVGNSFPTCNINFTAQEIMGQTKENK